MIKLSPHHLLCASLYVEKGYCSDFCGNFSTLLSRLKEGENFVLIEGLDDICAFCPHAKKEEKLCASQQKVAYYDESILTLLNLRYGALYGYGQILNNLKNHIPFALNFCGDCQWQSLCRDVSKKYE